MTEPTDALLPCPFCGSHALLDAHADDCYFTLHSRLKGSGGDASLVLEAHAAWNRRAPAPVGVEPVAYRHMHDDGWEYYDAPTGDDCPGCQALYTREQVLAMGRAEMTSDERLEGVKRAARNVTRGGKEAAIAFLKRAGIMGEDGKIKPEFAADGIKQGGQHGAEH